MTTQPEKSTGFAATDVLINEFAGEPDAERAREIADKLLANPVIEDFSIKVEDA